MASRPIIVGEGTLAEAIIDCIERVPVRRIHLRFDLWRKLCEEICADDEWVGTLNGVPVLAGKPVREPHADLR